MKNLLLSCLILVFPALLNAQDCYWLHGSNSATAGDDAGRDIATDAAGNVYVIGDYSGSAMVIGSTTLTNTNASNYGGIFLAKYTADGNPMWARGTQNGQNTGVATDKFGNVYITGNFVTSMTFGTATLTCPGGGIFLAKYDINGNLKWAKGTGGIVAGWYDESRDVTIDDAGNPIITGDFYNSTLTFGTYTLTHSGGSGQPDYFIAKYDSSGNALWASATTGPASGKGFGVAADASNNIYSTSIVIGDSVDFGDGMHHLSLPVTFVTKYNPTGNVIWNKVLATNCGSGNGNTSHLAVSSHGDLYLAADFASGIKIGSDTLYITNGGNSDILLAKFDSAGTPIWAKCAGSVNYQDYMRGIALDTADNAYVCGFFNGTSITFGPNTLTNSISNSSHIFLAKYDAAGNAQWGKTSSSSGTVLGWGIAKGINENVYFTGNHYCPTLTFGNSSIPNYTTYDFFIGDAFTFNSGILSSTNVSCNGGHDGSAIAFANGGNPPYTFLWADSIPDPTNDTATSLAAGYHQVTITESYGCAHTYSVVLTEPPADSLHICLVTVDSASQHNVVMWDKTSYTDVDTFIIYREISTNNYQPIGKVPFDSLSLFVDTVRTLYFPNTGDPNAGTYRYKLRAHTTCGLNTGLSPFHNTIYFLNNNGTFYWVQPYSIQGSPNPVTSYILERDDNTTGNWHAVASVAGTQQLVSDPLYSMYQTTASWRVKTQWNITCTPTLRQANGTSSYFGTSYSNVYSNAGFGIKNNEFSAQVKVYPTPGNGMITIEAPASKSRIEVRSVLGEVVFSTNLQKERSEIDLSHLDKGSYFVHVLSEKGNAVKKIVIE